jgi:methyl-accepting chemotaxis protein
MRLKPGIPLAMKLPKDLSFGAKLVGILLVPLAAFIAAASYLIYSSIAEKQQIDQLKVLPHFSVTASALLHELQIERGLSAGYLGSHGKKFSLQLSNHTSDTDKRLDEFNDFLKQNTPSTIHPGVGSSLEIITSEFQRLSGVRNNIKSQAISLGEAVGYFTRINTEILGVITNLSIKSNNTEISRSALASANFMKAKELSGIIRAILTSTFSANQYAPGMRDKFITLVAQQEIYFSSFKRFADKEIIASFDMHASSPVFSETANMRNVALQTTGRNFGIDANHWFKIQTDKINHLKQVEDELTQNTLKKMEALSNAASKEIWINSIISLIIIFLTLILGSTLIKRLSRESRIMTEALESISAGVLSEKEYHYHTPSFNALQSMQRKLIEVNSSIGDVTHTVRSSAKEIAQSNMSLAQRAEEQGRNLEQTAAAMEQITATVQLNAENLQEGNQLSANANQHAKDGQQIVKKAVSAMKEINDDSSKIVEIINVIDEIAFQTNLLALNAAVEAARAGEQGRGFAVVASEVRNLAQRSADAAQEIKTLIEGSVKKVELGSTLVNASGESLNEIVDVVTKVSDVISTVTFAGEEQASGVGKINQSVLKLDEVNQQNTVMVQEVAVSSRILEEQAKELELLISFYRTLEHEADTPANQPNDDTHPERRATNRPWSETGGASDEASNNDVEPSENDPSWKSFA